MSTRLKKIQPAKKMARSGDLLRLQKTNSDLRKVLSVNAKLNSTLDSDTLIEIIMSTCSEVMKTKAASLMLIDEASQELVFRVALGCKASELKERFRVKIGEGIAGTVAQTGKSVIVNDPRKDARFAKRFDESTGFSTDAILCVPLRVKDTLIGVLEAINPIRRKGFTEDDKKLCEIFADQAATAIDIARMHGEIMKQERSRQELKIAHEIQQNFMPDLSQNNFPIQIAAKNIPARDVGGDFYDCIHLDDSRIGIIIGDVSGKGVPAALYMVRTISEYRFLAPRISSPAVLLEALNNTLAKDSRFGMFVTLVYMVFDLKAQKLRYSSAGHHPLLVKEKGSAVVADLENAGGLPAGLTEGGEYLENSLSFSSGDAFFAYTDGVIEARDKSKKEYSAGRLRKLLAAKQAGANEYAAAILQDLEKFTKGCEPHDDITTLAVVIP